MKILNDRSLISEAYQLQLLKESIPTMTLSQVGHNIDLLSENEAEYVVIVAERVLNEFFGGLKALAGGAGKTAGQAGSSIGGGLKNLAQSGINKVKQVGKGIGQAANQVGNNVKDIYQSAEGQKGAEAVAAKAKQYVDALTSQLQQAQQQGMISFKGDIGQIPLGDIIDELMLSAQGHGNVARSAQNKGVFGGTGKAFSQGMQG